MAEQTDNTQASVHASRNYSIAKINSSIAKKYRSVAKKYRSIAKKYNGIALLEHLRENQTVTNLLEKSAAVLLENSEMPVMQPSDFMIPASRDDATALQALSQRGAKALLQKYPNCDIIKEFTNSLLEFDTIMNTAPDKQPVNLASLYLHRDIMNGLKECIPNNNSNITLEYMTQLVTACGEDMTIETLASALSKYEVVYNYHNSTSCKHDMQRIIALHHSMTTLETKMATMPEYSVFAKVLNTLLIGTKPCIEWFATSVDNLPIYPLITFFDDCRPLLDTALSSAAYS
jgi:hypothetical protein